jgi:hypothetical protein
VWLPVVAVTERNDSGSGIEAARGVVKERAVSAGDVEAARGVATERSTPMGGGTLPGVARSAST